MIIVIVIITTIMIITTIIMVTRPTVDRVKPGITFLRLYGRVKQTKATINNHKGFQTCSV